MPSRPHKTKPRPLMNPKLEPGAPLDPGDERFTSPTQNIIEFRNTKAVLNVSRENTLWHDIGLTHTNLDSAIEYIRTAIDLAQKKMEQPKATEAQLTEALGELREDARAWVEHVDEWFRGSGPTAGVEELLTLFPELRK